MKYILPCIFCFLIIWGCKKDEELISGNIEGTVRLIRSNFTPLPPAADIRVALYSNSKKVDSTETNGNGTFEFTGLPYGRYSIRCNYPGYIRSYYEQPIYHVGGYSATRVDDYLYHVPEYQIQIESVTFDSAEYNLIVRLKVDGDTLAPEASSFFHAFRAFMSNSPGVSNENYSIVTNGNLADWAAPDMIMGKVAVYGKFGLYGGSYVDWESIKSQPIYIILYPIANNQGNLPREFVPGSLGPPSNEISFEWKW
jgi:hypothetical protein